MHTTEPSLAYSLKDAGHHPYFTPAIENLREIADL